MLCMWATALKVKNTLPQQAHLEDFVLQKLLHMSIETPI